MSLTTIYLALGSNLGDRRALLAAALRGLADQDIAIAACSSIYETTAVADHPQPPYLNQVVRARTRLSPSALLAACQAVELANGRVRPPGINKAARTLDIDILMYGTRVVRDPALTIPHPGLLTRNFVRIPLADVAAPGLRHPVTRERLDVGRLDASVRRLHEDDPADDPPAAAQPSR